MNKSVQLSQNQLKKSISAKQSKVKLKNILANPTPIFWPLLPNNSISTFKDILKSILDCTTESSTGSSKKTFIDHNFMIYGLSCVHRNLKAGKIDSLILSTSIQPKFIVQQVIQEAFSKKRDLKVICIDKVEEILREFRCAATAIGFTNQSTKNPFNPLHIFISKESEKFPIPEDFLRNQESRPEPKVKRQKPKSILDPNFKPSSLYLHKLHNTRERAFVPEIPKESTAECSNKESDLPKNTEAMDESCSSSSDLDIKENIQQSGIKTTTVVADRLINLSISAKTIRKNKKQRKKLKNKTKSYLPLVINRIQPNPNKKCKKSKKKNK